ncbi:MAG: adenylate/guanylate cyclase domain-containing protein, partial [bacterium]
MKQELPSTPIPSEQEHEKRQLAAIMFTDMVGYSALTQKNEALALALLQEQRRLLRAIFPKYAGREIESIGDAFFVEFASALQAARCAIAIQTNLYERNASAAEEKQIKIRIGLHLGDVVHLGKHVHGDGVNIAARIEPLAESGGICISEDVARQIQNKIELPLRKLGKSRLKNIQQAVQIYRIVLPWQKKSDSFAERFYFALKRRRRFWYRLAAAIFAIAILLIAAHLWLNPKTGTNPGSSLPPMKTVRLTSFQGEEYDPVLSPDGNAIAFSWNGQKRDNFDIYIKLVDAGAPLRLTIDAAGDYRPTWSPDGRYIAFVRLSASSRGLYVIPALGGTERKLAEAAPLLESSMCWSVDGASVLTADKDSTTSGFNIFAIALETGEKQSLTTTPRDCIGDHTPRVSPSGQMLAFVRMKDFGIDDIHVIPLAGGEPRQITFDKRQITGMSWTADSREIVFTSDQNLWRVAISGGAPKRLDVGGENAGDPSLSLQRHRLAYLQTTNNTNIWRIEIANPALPAPLISSTQENHFPHYSPDGNKIAFASNRSGSLEIWVCDSDGQNPVQLTFFGSGVTAAPRWSPDGRR